jgi:hypothetical protein
MCRCIGVFAQLMYVYTYFTYVKQEKLSDVYRWIRTVATIFFAIVIELNVLLPLFNRSDLFFSHIAFFGAVTGIGLAASPLATVREVLSERDSSSLPPHLCVMVFTQCSAWTIYGWLQRDMSTFANNLVGVILGAVQLGLIWYFPARRRLNNAATAVNALSSVDVSSKGDATTDRDVRIDVDGTGTASGIDAGKGKLRDRTTADRSRDRSDSSQKDGHAHATDGHTHGYFAVQSANNASTGSLLGGGSSGPGTLHRHANKANHA